MTVDRYNIKLLFMTVCSKACYVIDDPHSAVAYASFTITSLSDVLLFACDNTIYALSEQLLPFANTLALTPFPLWIGASYGIGLFWCKEDQNH